MPVFVWFGFLTKNSMFVQTGLYCPRGLGASGVASLLCLFVVGFKQTFVLSRKNF